MEQVVAFTVRVGDTVVYEGQERRVNSIKVAGVAAPYFRLEGVQDGLTSYRLCSLPDREDATR